MTQSDEAEFPHGWVLARPSYGFHRTFSRVVGRPALLGEYSRLSRQVRNGAAERITNTAYRVAADTGETVVLLIRHQGRHVAPTMILPSDWRPAGPDPGPELLPDMEPEPAPPIPSPAAPASSSPAPAAAPAPPAPSPARLSLGSTAAARTLQARLQRYGITPAG